MSWLLARLLRAVDEVVPVQVPTEVEESARDLVRVRRGRPGGSDAGPAPALETAAASRDRLLRREGVDRCPRHPAAAAVVPRWPGSPRLRSRTPTRASCAHHRASGPARCHDHGDGCRLSFTPVVRRLSCLRGISTLTAFSPGGGDRRLGALHRCRYRRVPGLVPSEHSSGSSCDPRGRSPKTGNSHVRRMLVESVWHHRKPYRPATGRPAATLELAPPAAVARLMPATIACTSGGSPTPSTRSVQ